MFHFRSSISPLFVIIIKIAQRLVFADPLDGFNLLLLGCSKLELYDYLSEYVQETEQDYLTELIIESKNALLTAIEFDTDKNKSEVSDLILGFLKNC
jgi:hypothetical protein